MPKLIRSILEKNTKINRRTFSKSTTKFAVGSAALISGCQSTKGRDAKIKADIVEPDLYDFIIIGSGAGGGPLAANLARKNFRVLLMEAGENHDSENYRIPALHTQSTEDPNMAWDFFVKHYADPEALKRDKKSTPKGIFYPRAATLGGCTAHNAMILLYPENSDWDRMARAVDDRSFNYRDMRKLFVRLENNKYTTPGIFDDRELSHGYRGWLPVSQVDRNIIDTDSKLTNIVRAATDQVSLSDNIDNALSSLDPNDWFAIANRRPGIYNTPLTTLNGARASTREYILKTVEEYPDNLHVFSGALATKIVLNENKEAVAVEYLKGKSVYQADPRNRTSNPEKGVKRVKNGGEIIVAGGAFNTPQLLMLSGIGPYDELEKVGIRPQTKELKGVGRNLQDRYEMTYVTEMKSDFDLIKPCNLGASDDPCIVGPNGWNNNKKGVYTTNGAVAGIKKFSTDYSRNLDIYVFGLIGDFTGYYPNYSKNILATKKRFTWAALKGQTRNKNGYVKLKSKDPTETPEINFNFFDKNNAEDQDDLNGVINGLKLARSIMRHDRVRGSVSAELDPPSEIMNDDEKLRQYVKDNCWGHHASCSCKMGVESDPFAVVDSKFRVFHTKNLRIVDASVFPTIPGLFIVSSIYIISEKASDVIARDYIRRQNT